MVGALRADDQRHDPNLKHHIAASHPRPALKWMPSISSVDGISISKNGMDAASAAASTLSLMERAAVAFAKLAQACTLLGDGAPQQPSLSGAGAF